MEYFGAPAAALENYSTYASAQHNREMMSAPSIDEVHNLLSGSRLQQRRLLNLLRWLGNELQIPLIAVGTADAMHAIQVMHRIVN